MAELETNRLLLQSAHPRLAGALSDYYVRNRAFFARFDPLRSEEFFTAAEQRSILRGEVRRQRDGTGYRFYLSLRDEPGPIIGLVGLNNIILGTFRSCFLSYKLDEAHRNTGLMSEAIGRVAAFAFDELGLHRIEGNVMPWNAPSLRVLEKCGFVNEGLSPKYLMINGKWEDHVHMVLRNRALE